MVPDAKKRFIVAMSRFDILEILSCPTITLIGNILSVIFYLIIC